MKPQASASSNGGPSLGIGRAVISSASSRSIRAPWSLPRHEAICHLDRSYELAALPDVLQERAVGHAIAHATLDVDSEGRNPSDCVADVRWIEPAGKEDRHVGSAHDVGAEIPIGDLARP